MQHAQSKDDTSIVRRFIPCYVDHFQSATYRHTETRLYSDGSLMALFADGAEVPSVYLTVEDMIAAGQRDYLERVREVTR